MPGSHSFCTGYSYSSRILRVAHECEPRDGKSSIDQRDYRILRYQVLLPSYPYLQSSVQEPTVLRVRTQLPALQTKHIQAVFPAGLLEYDLITYTEFLIEKGVDHGNTVVCRCLLLPWMHVYVLDLCISGRCRGIIREVTRYTNLNSGPRMAGHM